MGYVRVRQHVNPLSQKYQGPVTPPNWEIVYADPTLPLHLDIGCGRGNFLLDIAQAQPNWNFLGLEIREPLVLEANHRCQQLNLTNLHFLFCNVNTSLHPLLGSLKPGRLRWVSIQFPDPWFKQRHQKRRVVQPALVNDLATYLSVGGTIFVQSDVEQMAQEICDRIQTHPNFCQQSSHSRWGENPLPVASDRERSTLARGEPIYRALFKKVDG